MYVMFSDFALQTFRLPKLQFLKPFAALGSNNVQQHAASYQQQICDVSETDQINIRPPLVVVPGSQGGWLGAELGTF